MHRTDGERSAGTVSMGTQTVQESASGRAWHLLKWNASWRACHSFKKQQRDDQYDRHQFMIERQTGDNDLEIHSLKYKQDFLNFFLKNTNLNKNSIAFCQLINIFS